MDKFFKQTLWHQFGAAILMLENAINACPDHLWDSESQFWCKSYHTLFYLDYYSSTEPENFRPPAPFTLSEFDSSGILPERVYSKVELINYLQFARQKCYQLITGLTNKIAEHRFINVARDYSMLEIIVYNMRHVQHHTAQLSLLLKQGECESPGWISRAK
ncbi:MAG: DinB family protein [Pedobacter sp.]|nr:DinB family protein [Pedobacter sp.]